MCGWNPAKKLPSWLPRKVASLTKNDLFWMVELSVPELFSANRRKVGEVLLHTTRPIGDGLDWGNLFCVRVPGCLALFMGLRSTGTTNKPQFFFYPVAIDDHTELFGC
jgi:hypothetical protein